MNFINVKLILSREVRDQLRDRRTLFMMFVLPILLYPLIGMSFLQVQQFMQEKPVAVWVIGAKELPDEPPLLENDHFAVNLFNSPGDAELLELTLAGNELHQEGAEIPDRREEARLRVQAGQYDAVLYFPEEFSAELEKLQQAFREEPQRARHLDVPWPTIISTTANEKSLAAHRRLSDVLDRWTRKVGEGILESRGMPVSAARPFNFDSVDVAGDTAYRGAALWSKILPVLMLIWALTGAFYPAVDLCAGEKERGTLETLLCSPAERSEIVLGKLLTVMLFSMTTAVLNLISVGVTGWLIFGRMPEFGPPPPTALPWLAAALVPVSALFSALCLALAAFARSTKEGQYYLMPLLLITMPLAIMPMAPGVELNLGNALIPVTGVVLLLRSLLEGGSWQALQFLPVVVSVTLAACLLAIRWAVDQFNSEAVLFRESEQLDVGLWLRHLMRDRQPTPSATEAVFCSVLILLLYFFMNTTMQTSMDSGGIIRAALITQLTVIAAPALLMTLMLTKSPRQTLLLQWPPWLTIPAAAALAVVLHPVVSTLHVGVQRLYPVGEKIARELMEIQALMDAIPLWQAVLVFSLAPAICEELAFRGFVLSGFRHVGHKWRAIVYSALFFGFAHGILQQSLMACLIGTVIGFVAVQSGSILPGMIYHSIHNSLLMSSSRVTPEMLDRWPVLKDLTQSAEGGYLYRWPVVAVGCFLALLLLVWFGRIPYRKSAEEELQEAITCPHTLSKPATSSPSSTNRFPTAP